MRSCEFERVGLLSPVIYRWFQGPHRICSIEDVAEAIGVGKDMLYRASNRTGDIAADVVVELDSYISHATGRQHTPCIDALRRAVEGQPGNVLGISEVLAAQLNLQERLGEQATAIREAIDDGRLTGPELKAIRDTASRLVEDAQALIADLEATFGGRRG